MSRYALEFLPRARKVWDKLDQETKRQLARRLTERQANPRIVSALLSGMPDCYKIKLKARGLRLVYRVEDDRLIILVLAIGPRERNEAYRVAEQELRALDERPRQ